MQICCSVGACSSKKQKDPSAPDRHCPFHQELLPLSIKHLTAAFIIQPSSTWMGSQEAQIVSLYKCICTHPIVVLLQASKKVFFLKQLSRSSHPNPSYHII